MMKRLICIIMILLLAGTVIGQGIDGEAFAENIDLVKNSYNDNLDNIPGFVKSIIGTERINAHLSMNDGSMLVLGAVTEDARILELSVGEISEPTLNIYLSEKVIMDIQNSDNPVDALEAAIKDGDITYKAVGMFKKLKFGFVGVAMKLGFWFKGVFGK